MKLHGILFWLFLNFGGLAFALVPVFSGISPLSVLEGTKVETLVGDYTVTDPDAGTITACSHTGDSGEFDIRHDSATVFKIYVIGSANLNYDTTPSYTLAVTCTDSSGETATENIQVDVTPNQPPTLTAPPSSFSVGENVDIQTLIYTLTVSDTEGDTVTCNMSSNPATTAFGIWQNPSDYAVFLNNNPGLNYNDVSVYAITLNCSDDFGSSTQSMTVHVVPNVAPTFDNTPYSVSKNAKTTAIGDTIFTVTATDTDSSTLTFTMTSLPSSPTFFTIDSVTGVITATQDLVYTLEDAYTLAVTVSDGKTTTTETIAVTLTDVNIAPVINNLPDTVNVPEDTAGGSAIFTLATSDPDTGDTENVTYTLSQAGSYSKFSYNAASRQFSIATGEMLDHETLNTYRVHFMISDNKAETGPYTLTIQVTDVNEACNFSTSTYHATTYETISGGGNTDPGIVVSDEDTGSSYSLSLVTSPQSSYFNIDGTTGEITFAVNYDVDSAHPTNVTLTVKCTDDFGATSTATLSMTILDVNDNTPEFGSTGYIYYSDQYDKPGQTVATISAADIDSGENADVEYTWTSSGIGSQKYELSTHGEVVLLVDPSTMVYGETYEFIVTARDQGSPRLSSTTTVHMIHKEVTTTTSTTTSTTLAAVSDVDFWDEPANLTLVVLAVLLALAALALIAYMMWKYCLQGATMNICPKNCCQPTQRVRKIKPKPSPKKTPFDFWHESEFTNKPRIKGEIKPMRYPAPAPIE